MSRTVRWWIEAGTVVVVWFGLTVYNARQTCESPDFGLPSNCDDAWVLPVVIAVALLMLAIEGAFWLRDRTRSRPCPRCGRRVAVGTLDCDACSFDFRTVGSINDERPAQP